MKMYKVDENGNLGDLIVNFSTDKGYSCHLKDAKTPANKSKWSIYNNTLPWSQLSDKQKGKLLLAGHNGITISMRSVIFFKPAFDDGSAIYKAIKPETVKPEPTMAELLTLDILSCSGFLRPHDVNDLIAKGWTKPCK
jgi:hypothetical protein